MLNGLSLFSGIGGIDVALSEYVRPIAYCEIDPYCQAVLFSRMADESLPNAPIWDDITTLSGLPFNGNIDIIYGGFPCQGISVAGAGKGLEDERSGLFFEIMRLAKEIKPSFIFLENTKGILSNGGIQIIETLASVGYSCRRKESPPPFYRMDDDLSFRVDRVKALGNSVCVEQTKEAFKELIGIKSDAESN